MANSTSIKANLTLVTTLDTAVNVAAYDYTATRPFVVYGSNFILTTAGLNAKTLTIGNSANAIGTFTTPNPSVAYENDRIATVVAANAVFATGNKLRFSSNDAGMIGTVYTMILPTAI